VAGDQVECAVAVEIGEHLSGSRIMTSHRL
jgi:hypothetical protein